MDGVFADGGTTFAWAWDDQGYACYLDQTTFVLSDTRVPGKILNEPRRSHGAVRHATYEHDYNKKTGLSTFVRDAKKDTGLIPGRAEGAFPSDRSTEVSMLLRPLDRSLPSQAHPRISCPQI